ncbi:MAG: FAD-dependent oxidoreductase [Arenicellales bacterium]
MNDHSSIGSPVNRRKFLTAVAATSALALVRPNAAAMAAGIDNDKACDVLVYGDTSGGVTAAVQAARSGKSVILIAPYMHLGGMTSSGLGMTDVGRYETVTGLAREFYHRAYQYYTRPGAWHYEERDHFYEKTWNWKYFRVDGALAQKIQMQFLFEPHVAEEVFNQMAQEAGVRVVPGKRLDLINGVTKQGTRIVSIRMDDGDRFAAAQYIDATYEGDLMAHAGVSYTVGREPNSKYGEQYNGIRPGRSTKVDPYVARGMTSSGLLPRVQPDLGGKPGDGDDGVQAYNYRLCLTNIERNRVPIPKPQDYHPQQYELLGRLLQRHPDIKPEEYKSVFVSFGGRRGHFVKMSKTPNFKTDSNNAGLFSSDMVGANQAWPDGDYVTRQRIAKKIKTYDMGLLWFAAHDSNVPKVVRETIGQWGLAKDEFQDNDHWPYRVYVREARRMVGEYVLTEHDARGLRTSDDGVALASYPIDSHAVKYYVGPGDKVWIDGGMSHRSKVFPISYRAICPKRNECTNLVVIGAVSASHSAFSSIRMEPVFMMVGQAAGAAAAIAHTRQVDMQTVPYSMLQERLTADGLLTAWPPPDANR